MEHQHPTASATIEEFAAALANPAQALAHADLAPEDQRAILASWASDARAIPDAPGLRRLESGAVVRLADILLALRDVDQRAGDDDDPPPVPAAAAVPPRIIRTVAVAA